MRVDQVQKIVSNYMQNSGRGGFITGVVSSIAPLVVTSGKLVLGENSLYITDSCIGLALHLRHTHACPSCGEVQEALQDHVELRPALRPGDGVLLLCRPDNVDGVKYILIDRIQSYIKAREVAG